MNREIKFRGKSIFDGRWFYGDLFRTDLDGGVAIQYYAEVDCWMTEGVNPKTVGQYTGMNDTGGNPIYEGDIVDCDYILYDPWDDGKESLDPMRCVVEYDNFGFIFKKEEDMCYFLNDVKNIKVVGNIHDNPELMEGGAQ